MHVFSLLSALVLCQATPALTAKDITNLTDDQTAILIARETMGDLNVVTESGGKKQVKLYFATGETDRAWYDRRAKYTMAHRPPHHGEMCDAAVRASQLPSSPHCDSRRGVYLAYVVAERLSKVPEDQRLPLLEKAVRIMGSTSEQLPASLGANYGQLQVTHIAPTPFEQWERPQQRLALAFARLHKLSAAAELEKLVGPPRFKCAFMPSLLAKEHLGGGRYADVVWHKRAMVKNGENMPLWGDADCAKLPAASTEFAAVKRSEGYDPRYVAAEALPGKTWEVLRTKQGVPERQIKMFRLYERIEE